MERPVRAVPELGCPAPEFSRKGRDNQRYSTDGQRLVAGCLPVRIQIGETGPDAVRVLLINASRGEGLVFPKGGWETDETVEAAARRETVEEAGVRGNLEDEILGSFGYTSSKLAGVVVPNGFRNLAYIFVMHVTEELSKWPEREKRTRHWVSVEEACARSKHDWMRDVLRTWAKREGWTNLNLA